MIGLDYSERVLHEMQSIPLSFYHLDKKHSCYHMPLHWHHSFELVKIVSGKLTIHINNKKVLAESGDIFLINQENIHGYFPKDCVYEVIDFDVDELLHHTSLCKNVLHIFTNRNVSILPFDAVSHAVLYHMADSLFHFASMKSEYHDLLVLGALFELLGTIYVQHHYTENHKISSAEKRFKPILEFIENNYMQPITLCEMAQASCMSTSHFCALFREFFGQTPMGYLNSYRIERASLLLANTGHSVTEIAHLCGFNDSAYFVKVFKKHKNITPKKYRGTLQSTGKNQAVAGHP